MLNRRSTDGFTLIELLVAMAIVGIMVAMATPSFMAMTQNSRLGSAAKSIALGLQTARTEAIRRNTPVEFVMTNSPTIPGVETSAVADVNGKSWVVRSLDVATGTYQLIEARAAAEGAGQGSTSPVVVQGAATSPPSATFTGIVTFNGLGGTAGGETLAIQVSNPAGGVCATQSGPMRCQVVQVRAGGQVHACDPAAATGDSRAC